MKVNRDRLESASKYFNSKLVFMDYLESYNLLTGSVATNQGIAICCPFHEDWDPSFKIDINRNLYKCFACGEDGGGNLIKFISRYETEVLGKRISYSQVLDRLLKTDKRSCIELGFTSVFDDSFVDLNSIKMNGIKRFKLKKETPKDFLSLSNYIKSYGSVDDKIKAMKLMQEGFNAELIYNMMFGLQMSSEFSGMTINDLLKED